MSYPPDASRSCHEADGRSDRSGGSGGGGGVYGTICSSSKWPNNTVTSYEINSDPILNVTTTTSTSTTTPTLTTTNTNQHRILSNWKKWSLGLDYLLKDSEGVALFKSYLQYEGCSNLLDFWFACQGFRSKVDPSDHRKIIQLIKAIYRTYIRGSSSSSSSSSLNSQPLFYLSKQQSNPLLQNRIEPIRLRSETRHAITERISRKHTLDQTVFDTAQAEVEQFLRTTAYPAFLKSDIYVDFLQTTLEEGGCIRKFPIWEQTISNSMLPCIIGGDNQLSSSTSTNLTEYPSKLLPTLDEDRELQSEELSLLHSSRHTCRLPCCHMISPNDPATTGLPDPSSSHCLHCKNCHAYNPYLPIECSQPILRPPWYHYHQQQLPMMPISSSTSSSNNSSAPLTMENLQMTRFYRTELSLQQSSYFNPYVTRPGQENESIGRTNVTHACSSSTLIPWHLQNRPNYVYTHWADAMCPPSMDPRLGNLPSQPPNPYHISYAPVSARDSEHHSLSSDARTDDTHSHTDSSHEGACNRLRTLNHRYPSPFQLSRSHNNNNNNSNNSNNNINNKRQNQLSQHHPPQHHHHHHHHHHHQRHLSTSPQVAGAGAGDLTTTAGQCLSPKCSSAAASATSSSSLFPSHLQQSIPYCRSPIGVNPSAAVGGNHVNYPLEIFSTTTNCPMNIVSTINTTTTTNTCTTNSSNNQVISEKIIQHSIQQQKHQRRLTRRGVSSRAFNDKIKLHSNTTNNNISNNNYGITVTAGNSTGLTVPLKPTNKSSTSRSYSMAEHDPKGFAQILSEKLQRLLNNQLVMERLDHLMIETSPNIQETQEPIDESNDVIITNKNDTFNMSKTSTNHLVICTTTNPYSTMTNTTNTTTTTTTHLPISQPTPSIVSSNVTSIVTVPTTTMTTATATNAVTTTTATTTTPSVLQRPWADKLLAAARVQHENTRENAQAILEDHCSRIWAASADRTPSSSGGGDVGSGGDGSGSGGHHHHHHPRDEDDDVDDEMLLQRNFGSNLNECTNAFISSPCVNTYQHDEIKHWSHCNHPMMQSSSSSQQHQIRDQQSTLQSGSSCYQDNNNNNNQTRESYHQHQHPHQSNTSTIDSSVVTKSLPLIVPPWFKTFSQSTNPYQLSSSVNQSRTHCTEEHLIKTIIPINNDDHTTIATQQQQQHDDADDVTYQTENSPINITHSSVSSSSNSNSGSSGSSSSASCTTATTTTTTTTTTTASNTTSRTTTDQHHQTSIVTTTNTTSHSTHSSTISTTTTTSNSTPAVCTASNSLVIGYYMGDDPVPYRSLWPSTEITLGQFKQLIPKKKGLFRYFFKKASDEFDSGVVHQEITNEDTILPLWEGKIVAKVERID